MKIFSTRPSGTVALCGARLSRPVFTALCFLLTPHRRISAWVLVLGLSLGAGIPTALAQTQNCSVNAGVPATICQNQPMTLNGQRSSQVGSFTPPVVWTQVGGPAVTIVSPTSLTTSVIGYAPGFTYTFRLTATCQDGSQASQTVTRTVNPISTAQAGPDQASCPGLNALTLTGNAAGAGETADWLVQSPNNAGVTVNSPSASTTTLTLAATSAGSTRIVYRIRNLSTGCSSTDTLVITNRGGVLPVDASVSRNPNVINLNNCYSTTQTVQLDGSFGGNGTGGQLGTWSVVSGPAVPSIANVNDNNTLVQSLVEGTYVLRWTVTGPCATGSSDVTINVPPPSQDVSASGSLVPGEQIFCDARTTALLAAAPPLYTGENVLWSFDGASGPSPSTPTLANANTPTASVSGLNPAPGNTYTFRYTVTPTATPGCANSATTTIRFIGVPTINVIPTSVTLLCDSTETSPTASNPRAVNYTASGGTGTSWQIVSFPAGFVPPARQGTNGNPQVIAGLNRSGTYVVRFFQEAPNGPTCQTTSDDVTIVVSFGNAGANAGTDQILGCGIDNTQLAGNDPTLGIPSNGNIQGRGRGFWGQISGPTTVVFLDNVLNVPDNTDFNTRVQNLAPGQYVFRWTVTNGTNCPIAFDDVMVRVFEPLAVTAGADQTICYGTATTLTGTPTVSPTQVGQWSIVGSYSPAPTIVSPGSPNTTVIVPSPSTTYTFRWTVTQPGSNCPASFDDVNVTTTATQGPTPANAGPDQCRTGFTTATLAGNGPIAGETGLWTVASGPGGSSFSNAAQGNTTINGLVNGTYRLVWTLSVAGCPGINADTVVVSVGGPAPANAGADLTVCGSSVTLLGSGPAYGLGVWRFVSGPAMAVISNVNSSTALFSNLIPGVYVYAWDVTNGACPGTNTDLVTITVSAAPSPANIAVASTSVCGNVATPGALSTTLTADAITAGTGLWTVVGAAPSVVSFSPSASASTVTVSSLRQGNYKFRWTVSGEPPCPNPGAFDEIDVFVQEYSYAGPDRNLCNATAGSTSVTLDGNGPSGTWTFVSSTNGDTPVGSAPNGDSRIFSSLETGTYIFSYTVAVNPSAACPAPVADQVSVTVTTQASPPNAGPDQERCSNASPAYFQLAGSAIAPPQTGLWVQLSIPGQPSGTFDNPALPNARFTPFNFATGTANTETYVLEWRAVSPSDPTCYVGDQIRLVNYREPSDANAGPDQLQACAPTVQLAAVTSTPFYGTPQWSLVSVSNASPNPTIDQPFQANSTVTIPVGTIYPVTYVFRWTVSNGSASNPNVCVPKTDEVSITIPFAPPTPAAAGPDRRLCNVTAIQLQGNTPVVGTGQWSLAPGSPYALIDNPGSPTTNVFSLSPGTYTFVWSITSGACVSRDTAVFVNDAPASPANAGPDMAVCEFTPVMLAATAPTSGTGTWTVVSQPAGSPPITFTPSANSPSAQANGTVVIPPGSPSVTYVFRWTVNGGPTCPPSSDDVTVMILRQPTQADAGPNQTICVGGSVTLTGNTPTFGMSTWSKISGPTGSGEVIVSPTSSTTQVTGFTVPGTYVYEYRIGDAGNCASSSTVAVFVRPIPVIASAVATCAGGQGTGVITVTASISNASTLEYSRNGTNWFTSNIFNNVPNGPYTIRVRDQAFPTCQATIPVTVNCVDNPVVGAAKLAGTPVAVGGLVGVFDVPYTVTVQNLGNVAISNVQVTDNLVPTFPAPATFTIQTAPATGGGLSANAGFNGNSNQNLLVAGSSSLAIGATQTITFTVRVSLNGSTQTTFNNQAFVGGTGPNGTNPPTDPSNNGGPGQIDPSGNGNPGDPGENTPTPVTISTTVIGVAKAAGTPVFVNTGVYDVPYTVYVRNLGNQPLTNVQVTDNLTTTFPAPITYTLSGLTAQGPLTSNPAFNGNGNQNLLTGASSTLQPGDLRTITFTVRITLNGSTQTLFNNQVTASATGAAPDLSNNGDATAIDVNTNGNPGDTTPNEGVPTPVTISSGQIGLAKRLVSSAVQPNGSYNLTYEVIVRNAGNMALSNVQVSDDLTPTYPAPATFSIVSVTNIANAPDVNAGFLGTPGNPNLLNGTGTLAVSATKTIQFVVNVRLNGAIGSNGSITYFNNAIASGTPPGGLPSVSDVSNNGSDPNPVGSVPTPAPLNTRADLSLVKTVSAATVNVNDNVTYTLVVSNAGPNGATNVEVKDVLPAGLQFVSSPNLVLNGTTLTGTAASIPNGGTATFTFVAKVLNQGITTNGAEISRADQGDVDSTPNNGVGNGEDDQSSVPVTAQSADLSLTKTVSNTSPNVGQNVIFTITVNNAGPNAALNVTVRDVLPAGLSFVSSASTPALVNNVGVLSNTTPIASIPSGGSAVLSFVATVTQPGPITNRAEVFTSGTFDPDSSPGNGPNTGEDDEGGVVLNGQQIDLSLDKTVNNPTAVVGDTLTYTITVSNAGPNAATGVRIQDVLPASLTFVDSPNLVNASGTLSNNATPLSIGVGANVAFSFRARVNQYPLGGIITNEAQVQTADQFDPDSQPGNATVIDQDDNDSVKVRLRVADLSLLKTVSNTTPSVGQNATFTMTVTNAGPDPATGVTVTDVLPAGLTFVSSLDFSNVAGTLSTAPFILGVGSSRALTFVATVTQPGPITNAAQVATSREFDPDSQPGNGTGNAEDDRSAVQLNGQQADLQLIKLVSNATPNVGDTLTYTIRVTNLGPNGATGVQVTDVLPVGLQFVSSSDFGLSGSTLTASGLSIAFPGQRDLLFRAKVLGTGPIKNRADITASNQFDPTPGNNRDSVTVTPTRIDLSLVKTVSNASPNVGDNVTYTITVSNAAGLNTATNVVVTDPLPAGLTFVSSPNFTLNAGVLTSNVIPSITSGGNVALTFIATVTQSGPILNRAEVTRADQRDLDSNPGNGFNGEDDNGSVLIGGQQADVSLRKTVSNATPNVGETITYTIAVRNDGPSPATGVFIRDVLPANLTFVPSAGITNTAGVLSNTAALSIPVGNTVNLNFQATVSSYPTATAGIITNFAQVQAANQFDGDSQPGNFPAFNQDDNDSVKVRVKSADLSLLKTVSNATPSVGQAVTYTIAVTNAGPDAATNVTVRDVLPLGLTFVSSANFTNAAGTLTASIPLLNVGVTQTLSFVATVTQNGAITNRAQVQTADQFDPDSTPGNGDNNGEDDRSAATLNGQQADLSLTKTASAVPVNVGQNVTYTLVLSNAGPSTSRNIQIRDVLPPQLQYVSSVPALLNTGGTLTANLDSLPAGQSVTYTFVAKLIATGSPATASIPNTAEVSAASTFDPDSQPGNANTTNQDDDSTATIRPLVADLRLAKTVSNASPNVGSNVTYTLTVTNDGPDAATNVRVRDVLPPGLTFVSSSNFTQSPLGVLTSGPLSIANGGSTALTFVATVTQSGPIVNRAEVSTSDQFDTDSQPNTGTTDGQDDIGSVLIGGQQADLSLRKTVNNPNPNVGDTLTYTISVRNDGPSPASGVQMSDVLPAGLAFVSSATLTNTAGTLTNPALLNIPVGNVVDLTFRARITAFVPGGSIVNDAQISAADQFDGDSQPGNGGTVDQDDNDSVRVRLQRADLTLSKTVNNPAPSVGQNVTFTITVFNQGTDPASGVVVRDALPAGLTFVSSPNFTNVAGVLTSTSPISIPVGSGVPLTFVATVTQSGPITNRAQIFDADQFDIDSSPGNGDNQGEDDDAGVMLNGQQADLSLDKTVSNTRPNVGEVITYTITVSNAGPNAATGVRVQDVLPASLQFVSSATLAQAGSLLTGGPVAIPVNGSALFTFTAKVLRTDSVYNRAQVTTSDQFDPDSNPGNGFNGEDDADSVRILPRAADLRLTKLVSTITPNVGALITYTIRVQNFGPDSATNVTVRDQLPAGLQFSSSADFSNNAGLLTSTSPVVIAPGGFVNLTFVALVTQPGPIVNRAEVATLDPFDPTSTPGNGTSNGEDDQNGVQIGGQQADLSLVKTVSNATPNLNQPVTYTIQVTNAGPNTATNVQVRDVLPASLTLVNPNGFAVAGSVLTQTIPSLAAGNTVSLTFIAAPNVVGTIVNGAEIFAADQFDPDSQPGNANVLDQDDNDTVPITVKQADLSLDKSVDAPQNVNVGSLVTFRVRVTNAGPSTATNVQVQDALPAGLSLVNPGDFTSVVGNTLSTTIPAIAAGTNVTLRFFAKVDSSGLIVNRASVTGATEFDPDLTNNSDTASVGGRIADLSLVKLVSNQTPNVGDTLTYTLIVSNAGPDNAQAFELRDVLPAQLTFIDGGSGLAHSGGTITTQVDSLAAGNSLTFSYRARLNAYAPSVTNVAEVSKASTFDPDSQPGNVTTTNQDDDSTATVRPRRADLSLAKTVSNASPNVNDVVTFTLTVSNAGPDAATNVRVRDVLPAGLTFVSSSNFVENPLGVLQSNVIPSLASGGNVALTFQARVTANAISIGGPIINKAQVSASDQFDPDSQPNSGTEDGQDDVGSVMLNGQQADLSLVKTVNDATPDLADTLTYTISVTNAGPNTATNVAVRDVLPASLSFVSSPNFTAAGQTLTALVPSLGVGQTVNLTLRAKITAPGATVNGAEVSAADQFDPDSQPGNGSTIDQDDNDSVRVVVRAAELSVRKIVSDLAPSLGTVVTYTLTVTNQGPDVATNVVVRDSLPAGLTFGGSTDLSFSAGLLTATIPTLAVAVPRTLTFTARVDSLFPITNVVTVRGREFDPILPNNQDSVTVNGRGADLSIAKTVNNLRPNLGDTLTYTVTVTNDGPNGSTGSEVRDLLPPGLEFVRSDFFVNESGTLVAPYPAIPEGGSVSRTYQARVTQFTPQTNRVEISKANEFDDDSTPGNGPDGGEDDDDSLTVVPRIADLSLLKIASRSAVNVGDTLTFALTVSNAGPDTATAVRVGDVLPAGLAFVSSTDFVNNAGALRSNPVTVLPNGSQTLRFVARVTQPGTITNRAQVVSSDQADPDSQPNNGPKTGEDDEASATTGGVLAELSLTKTVDQPRPNVGDTVQFRVEVRNNGPATATGVTVRDSLPTGLVFVASSSFAPSGGSLLSSAIDSIPVGQSRTLTLTARVTGPGTFVNVAQVAFANEKDPNSTPGNGYLNGENDTDSASVRTQVAELSIQKLVSPGPYRVGGTLTYTLRLRNNGPDVATNVTITDQLPLGLTFDSSPDLSASDQTLTGFVATLQPGDTRDFTVTARFDNAPRLPRTNRVAINAADQFDPILTNNQDSVTVILDRAIDLSLRKTVNNRFPTVGQAVTFTIQVKNAGPDSATGVIVRDALPAGLSFVSSTNFSNVLGILTSTSAATIPAGDSLSLSFIATVTQPGSIINRAEVYRATEFDPDSNPGNGTTTGEDDEGGVMLNGRQIDLSLTKAVNNLRPNLGDTLRYTITVRNAGPDTATAVAVRDRLPAALDFVSSANFIASGNVLTGNVGSLAPTQSATLTVLARVARRDDGNITNFAEVVSAAEFDPDSQPANGYPFGQDDEDSVTVRLQRSDLSLLKTYDGAPSVPTGNRITYRIRVTNQGPDLATNVVVRDILPAGLTLVNPGDFTANGDTLTRVIPAIAAGTYNVLSFIADITTPGAVLNVARVTDLDQVDADLTNNQDSVSVFGRLADLRLAKTISDSLVNPGQVVTYTLTVTNDGPDAIGTATVRDALPDGIEFVSSASLFNFGGTLTGTVGALAPGASQSFSFQARVTGTGTIVNTAEIATSDTPDRDSTPGNTDPEENDQDSVAVRVRGADLSLAKLVSRPTPIVGDTVTYTLRVSNAGPDAATGVVVRDPLPLGLSFVSSTDFIEGPSGILLSNAVGVPAGGSTVLTFVARVGQSGTIVNRAEIFKADQLDGDSDPGNGLKNGEDDEAAATIGGQQADLSLRKYVSNGQAQPPAPNVFDTLTYTVEVYNAGPNPATGVRVRDVLPAGLQLVNPIDFSVSGSVLTASLPAIPTGETRRAQFKVRLTRKGLVTNFAQVVAADQFDPDSEPNNGFDNGEDDQDSVNIVSAVADLSLRKTVNPGKALKDSEVTYSLTVTNDGPDAATNIRVEDVLPAYLKFSKSDDFTNTAGTLSASIGFLQAGDQRTLTFKAIVLKDTVIVNKAQIAASDQEDPDSRPGNGVDNGEDDEAKAILGGELVDLQIVKTVSNPTPNLGDEVTYTLDVTNNGPADATNVQIRDVLPVGLKFVYSDDLTNTGGTLTATIGRLGVGSGATFTFIANVTKTGVIPNIVRITGLDQNDTDPGNDRDTATIRVQTVDLSLQKLASKLAPNVGETVTFSFVVANAGPDTATHVVVKDILPAGLLFVASTDFAELGGVLFSDTIPQILPGKTDTLRLRAKVTLPGRIVNKAEIVAADQRDVDSQPNTGTKDGQDDIGIVVLNGEQADLSLTKTVYGYASMPVLGDIVPFQLEVRNSGPATATNIRVKDFLPNGLEYVATPDFPTPPVGNVATSRLIDSIKVGQSVKLYIKTRVNGLGGDLIAGTIFNKAEISQADQFDPDSQPNNGTENGEDDASDAHLMPSVSDLSLRKTVDHNQAAKGTTVTYTVTVTNSGPDPATNVEVKDVLPAGLQFVSSDDFTLVGNVLTAKINRITPAQDVPLTFVARLLTNGMVINRAEVSKADQYDPDSTPGNGVENGEDDEGGVVVNGKQADLELRKTVSDQTPDLGDRLDFTITVVNKGPDEATNIVVRDLLPDGLKFIESLDFNHASGVLRNPAPLDLPAGDSLKLIYRVKVTKTGCLLNRAEILRVTEYDPDSQPGNGFNPRQDDTDSVQVCVRSADLSLQKLVDKHQAAVGETLTFSIIVKNAGPATANNVTLKDVLPAGLLFEDGDDFVNNKGTVTAEIASLAPGESDTLRFTAKLTKGGCLTNRAEITGSDVADPNSTPGNGTDNGENDEASVSVNCGVADLSLVKVVDNRQPLVGTNVNWSIRVTNAGPNTAHDVLVRDPLPTGLQFLSSNDFELTGGLLVARLDSILPGTTTVLTFKTRVKTAQRIVNFAEVAEAREYDPDSQPGNGYGNFEDDADSTDLNGPVSDLSLRKLVSNKQPNVGSNVTYRLVVSNAGPAAARFVKVVDKLPAGLQFVSSPDLTFAGDSLYGGVAQIAAGGSKTFSFVAKVTTAGVPILNKAQVADVFEYDPDSKPGNGFDNGEDDASSITVVGQKADLVLTKTVSPGTAAVGQTVAYTLTLTNNGPTTARGIQVRDALPAGLTYLDGDANIVRSGNVLTVNLDSLVNGNATTIFFRATVTGSGDIENIARATSTTPDPDTTNNVGRATVKVACPPVPVISCQQPTICYGQSVVLTATGCLGTVTWNTNPVQTGASITVTPIATTSYTATCSGVGTCPPITSVAFTVTVVVPSKPTITVSKPRICLGDSTTLTASGCQGVITWNTVPPRMGASITVKPTVTTYYTAACQVGTCPAITCDSVLVTVDPTCQPPSQRLGLSKRVASVEKVEDGIYRIAYVITARNLGSDTLRQVQVSDNLWRTFGYGALILDPVIPVSTNGTLTPNSGFTGRNADTLLLVAASSKLAPGASHTISFSVKVNFRFCSATTFTNTAYGSARGKDNALLTDASTDGTDIDPDADGDPGNNSQPTPVTLNTLPFRGALGLAMAVTDTLKQADGSYDVTYALTLENLSEYALKQAQVSDSLTAAFGHAAFRLVRGPEVSGPVGLTVNPDFNGTTDTRLLGEGNGLPAKAKATLSFVVNVRNDSSAAVTFLNSALASAYGDDSLRVFSDASMSGFVTDPDSSGSASDPGEDRATELTLPGNDGALFIPEGFSPNGDGVNDRYVIRHPAGTILHLQIFNRWGQLVYGSEDYQNDWDGKSNRGAAFGANLPDGTYYYVVQLSDGRRLAQYLTIMR